LAPSNCTPKECKGVAKAKIFSRNPASISAKGILSGAPIVLITTCDAEPIVVNPGHDDNYEEPEP
jgi:hypothetical protein